MAKTKRALSARGAQRGFEFFREGIDPEAAARSAAQTALTMLRAEHCPAGTMPVIIDGGFGGVIFHEACGHSLEATSVAFGNSEFSGKLGEKIASDCVTAIDDGTIPGEWGSINIDDEGTPSTRLVLIENGVLKNYMIDRLNSRRMHMPITAAPAARAIATRPPRAAQHLHRPRQRRRGGNHPHRGRRALRQADGRRLGEPRHRGIQFLRGGRVSDPRWQDRPPGARARP